MKKIVAHPAPKPLSGIAPKLGLVAVVILAAVVILQLIGISGMLSNLQAHFYDSSRWAIAVVIVALIIELAAIPFLLRGKLSYLASICSGVAAVLAPWVWVLVTIWMICGGDITETSTVSSQFGILSVSIVGWCGWLLLGFNMVWLIFNFYTVKELNIEEVWYKGTGLKPRSELKKTKK